MEDLNSLFNISSSNNDNNNIKIFEDLDKKETMLDYLPFNSLENEYTFNNIFDIDFNCSLFSKNKHDKHDKYDDLLNTKQIIERLNSFDNDYFKKIVVEDDKINTIENDRKLSFKSNLKIAERTLPGIIISFMHQKGEFISEDEIMDFVTPRFNSLRKTNGATYQVIFYLT